MKKGWKIFLGICGGIAALGLTLCIAGGILGASFQEIEGILYKNGIAVAGNKNVLSFGHGGAELVASGEQYQGIRSVEIEVGGVEVEFLPSEDEFVYVETEKVDEVYNFQCYQKGDTLEVHTTDKMDVFNHLDEKGIIRIFIPTGQLEELDIANGAGVVTVNGASARDFKIDVGAGEAFISDIAVQNAEFSCGAGQITASGQITGEVDIECGMGKVVLNLDGSEEEYSFDVECGMGEVVIGGQEFSGLGVEHHSDRHHGGEHHGKHISAECGMGSVCVSFR